MVLTDVCIDQIYQVISIAAKDLLKSPSTTPKTCFTDFCVENVFVLFVKWIH